MCEANAYLLENEKETLLLESVDIIEPLEDGSFRMVNIFGEQKIINAKIHKMELVEHRIVFYVP